MAKDNGQYNENKNDGVQHKWDPHYGNYTVATSVTTQIRALKFEKIVDTFSYLN